MPPYQPDIDWIIQNILGFVWLIGKNKTSYFLREILGKKVFGFLKVGGIVKKISKYSTR